MDTPLWEPSPERVAGANLTRFGRALASRAGTPLTGYQELHRLSVAQPELFWAELWAFGGVIGDRGEAVARDLDRMPGARFFPDARLNFAENLAPPSRRRGGARLPAGKTACREPEATSLRNWPCAR